MNIFLEIVQLRTRTSPSLSRQTQWDPRSAALMRCRRVYGEVAVFLKKEMLLTGKDMFAGFTTDSLSRHHSPMKRLTGARTS